MSVNRLTIYTSPADKAIGCAGKLFPSPRGRVGTVGLGDVDETIRAGMEFGRQRSPTSFAIVNFSGAADAKHMQRDRYGHSYFRDAPTVSADLVLLLRDDLDPGTRGRPLEAIGLRFWRVPPGYPLENATEYGDKGKARPDYSYWPDRPRIEYDDELPAQRICNALELNPPSCPPRRPSPACFTQDSE